MAKRGRPTKAIAALKALRENGTVERKPRKNPLEKVQDGKSGLRARVNAKCFECAGSSRKEVRLCNISGCPLWDVRPFQNEKVEDEVEVED